MSKQPEYSRFTIAQRLEHWIMSLSFTVLGVTGLPQRYALTGWGEAMIDGMGGIESVRIIHRVAAVVFMLVMIYHFVVVAHKIFVMRVRMTMMPDLGDARDLVNSILYYLNLTKKPPKMPRYNFAEKMEYWAVLWGGVLMTVTGFMLWNPIATTSFLPGQAIPAAQTAHSAEALLAVLAILIWHVYWVHIKTFNKAMFVGTLNRHQMEDEHMAELEAIEAGNLRPPPSPEVKQKRERIFIPVAALFSLVMVTGLYFFVTFEQTAITTVPPAETAQAFVPATPTPTLTPLPSPTPSPTPSAQEQEAAAGGEMAAVPIIPHEVKEGHEQCLMCHGPDAMRPFPKDHKDRPLETCLFCHSTEQENHPAALISHAVEGRDQCDMCHALDTLPDSHQEEEFTNEECTLCHQVADHIAAGPSAQLPPVPIITHEVEDRQECLACHGPDAMRPFPKDHEGRPLETCLFCHSTEQENHPAALIEHKLEDREQCTMCHALDTLPESHQDEQFTDEECGLCHHPAPQFTQ